MKHKQTSRILSLLLVVAMVFSMLPVGVFAAEGTATWSKVELTDITPEDTIAITMTNPNGVTYVLPSNETEKNSAPVVTVEGETLTTGAAADYGWTITAVDGGYTISVDDAYLFTIDNNNGVRVGATQGVWTLDGKYLSSSDGTNTRWLGVYDNNGGDYGAVASPNWRAYKNTTGNTKNQSVGFWKLVESTETPGIEPEPIGVGYELVTEVFEGDQVLMYNAGSGTAVTSTASGYKLAGESLSVAENVITTDSSAAVWTVGVDEDGCYTFTQGELVLGMVQSGNYVNLSTNASDGYTAWTLESSATEGVFYLKNVNMPASSYGSYYLEYYNGYTAYASNSPSDGQYGISFYKLVEEGNEEPTDPDPSEPENEICDIATALVGEEGAAFTVKGVVTLVDGSNVYVQDATGGICVRMSASPSDIALGDTIIGTGSKSLYNGLPQLGSATYEKSEGLTLSAKETTLDALALADICTYVKLSGLEVTEVYDSNGAYSTPNITVTDGTNSIQIYKAVVEKSDGENWDVQVGDKIDVTAAVGVYKTTLQLRNTLASEIVKVETETPIDPTDPTDPADPSEPVEPEVVYADKMTALPNDGDTIIIYNSGNALGAAANGKKLAGVAAEVAEGKLPISEEMAQLLVSVEENAYIFTLDGKYLTSAETGNGLSFADELTDCGKWTFEAAADGTWYIKNVGANYNGNYNQALEYYSGFTTYGIKETAIYQMELYLVEAAPVYPVPDGTYVIWAPEYGMALSSVYSGYYNSGVAVTETDSGLSGYTAAEIWTVTNQEDGSITISYDGQNLAMADSFSSMTLGEVNDAWTLEDAGDGLFYVKNAVRQTYIEWYAEKNNWSGYKYINSGSEGMFALCFTPVDASVPEAVGPEAGAQVAIYNLAAEGALAAQNDTNSINNVPGYVEEGMLIAENGTVVFTVEIVDGYYRFYNETYGYLCSNGTGNNAFYTQEASEDADWTLLPGKSGGWNLESRTAKYNGTYSQYLEYYADSYKTYSMYNVTDYDIYEFFFYPIAEGVNLTDGIVNVPKATLNSLATAYVGMDYTNSFTVDAVFGVKEVTLEAGGKNYECTLENGVYTFTIPATDIAAYYERVQQQVGSFVQIGLSISGTDNMGAAFSGGDMVNVSNAPYIMEVSPEANEETGENKRPTISAKVINADGAAIVMTVNGEEVTAVYENGMITYTPAEDMPQGRTTVNLVIRGYNPINVATKTWSFIVGEAQYQLYFGQLHSHTTYSDGSGSLESALDYIAGLPESANVDFVAFTDHSNYFDASGAANPGGALYDMSLATEASQGLWSAYKAAISDFNARETGVIAIGGFEMTWSGGPGHINTFNTEGIVSRNNTTLNNKTSDAGMKAYYALLSQTEGVDSISQFNHPGTTFGNFTDFAYWDALIDSRIQLVEVGNGEGQIGAGGYYPSYEQYTLALDKGWHVAPTNNQDNHKGKWGNANDARDVILTDDFSEEGIYQAIRDMRMYATEDKNLEIGYSVNGLMLGSTIEEVPEKLNIEVTVYDPDGSDSISKVEVIVNSGKVAYAWSDPADLADGALSVELAPDYSYYYIRVTEGDGDIAVTAPVWVGEMLKLGISAVETTTSTPVTDEELTITTTLFNSENAAGRIKSLVYSVGSQVIGTDDTGYELPASGTKSMEFKYIPTAAKLTKVTVTAIVELEGVEYTFTMDIELDVQDASKLVYIGIDASHYNEYVNGNYKNSMGNFSQLAAEYGVRTVTLLESADLIAACSNDKYVALILTAPSRRLPAAQEALLDYTVEELEAIKAFNANGGTVIMANWSDHYENYPDVDSIANMNADQHMAAVQNELLAALGSSLRMGDDATYDDDYNGGQAYRLYFNTYGDSFLTEGVEVDPEHPHDRMYTEVFSHYGGSSIYTVDGTLNSTVTPVVFGHSGTYSVDVDKDGLGGESMYKYPVTEGDERLMIMATEQLEGKGLIVVSGAAFMSNFEVQATIEDSGSEKNYSNYKVCENLLAYLNPVTVTDIAEVRAQTEAGYKYTIEGVVTSNASGYDKETAFFDCIYVQDETAGICCFPVAGEYKIGDLVRITGTTEYYQGEPELQVDSIEVIGEGTVEPESVTAAQINDRSAEGKLVKLEGVVDSFELANGLVQTILVKDVDGSVARVFIDGYITTAEDVKDLAVGNDITVIGLASYDNTFNAPEGPFPRIRVRDRADVVCTEILHSHDKDSLEYHEAVEATCHQNGMMAYYYCAVCDAFFDVDLMQTNTKNLTIPATVGLTHNVGTEACHVPGIAEYWYCVECQAVFADAAGTIMTNRKNLEIQPVCGLTYVAAVKPGCHEKGSREYWYCEKCEAVYEDEAGTRLTNRKRMAVDNTAVIKMVEAVASTCTVEGNIEYWYCSECKQIFLDEALTKPANAETVKLPVLENAACTVFADVDKDLWYHDAIDYVAAEGIMNGVSETTFAPDENTTRAQLATMLWRLAGSPTGNPDTKFQDLDAEQSWYHEAVKWAYAEGIIKGRSETEFDPNAFVTRQEMVTMFCRFYNPVGFNWLPKDYLNIYPDAASVELWAWDAMYWAVTVGLIKGNVVDGTTVLDPAGNTTRAQMATVLMRYIEDVVD